MAAARGRGVLALPEFPWDRLAPVRERAAGHPCGLIDLSVGSPVDPTPDVVQRALQQAANASGYPTVAGDLALREAICQWHAQARRTPSLATDQVMPVVGTKELVAWLPTLLSFGPEHTVVIPRVCYPTYEVGAVMTGAAVVRADATSALGPQCPHMWWLCTPSNPTGKILGVEHLRKTVQWARARGCVVVSDECYSELAWESVAGEDAPFSPSLLDPAVCDGDHTGLLVVHSLSKQASMAGYRAGWVTGDQALVRDLISRRKHLGMIVPSMVQAAMVAALDDASIATNTRAVYARRRELLKTALEAAGLRIDDSQGGLYLWATRGEDCWQTASWLADSGLLVAPGIFYGPAGAEHIRVALTAADEQIAEACARLMAQSPPARRQAEA